MLVGLPFCTTIVFYSIYRSYGCCWRKATMYSAVTLGVLVVALTEVLSLFRGLTSAWLAGAYLAVITGSVIIRLHAVGKRATPPSRTPSPPKTPLPSRWNLLDGSLVASLILLATVTAITALLAPPNVWDAMFYHMPRVVYWIQHRSVAFYSTPETSQLFQPPWAEYAILHLHLLCGGDGLSGLVQWFAFCGSAVGASLVAALLGADRRGQVVAALFGATIPHGVLSASGTKNDYVLSFWLLSAICFLLLFRSGHKRIDAVAFGAALGLSFLTKGTAYIYAPTIVLFGVILLGSKELWVHRWGIAAVLAISVLVNAGHYARNSRLFGSPLGPGNAGGCAFANGKYGFQTLSSNLIRNIALHLSTPSAAFNKFCERNAVSLLEMAQIDPNDPETTWCGTRFEIPTFGQIEENKANTLHMFVSLSVVLILLSMKYWKRDRVVCLYALIPVVGFILFCALLRWQPWHARLHLPLFLFSAPLVGVVTTRIWPKTALGLLMIVLVIAAGPSLFGNELRPLIVRGRLFSSTLLEGDRMQFYFPAREQVRPSYVGAANSLLKSSCRDIGIDYYGDGLIYPMLVLLGTGRGEVRLSNLAVANPSAAYTDGARPCAILCMRCETPERFAQYAGVGRRVVRFQDIVIFTESSGSVSEAPSMRIRARGTPSEQSADVEIALPEQAVRGTQPLEFMINSTFSGEHACWVQIAVADGMAALVNDDGNGLKGRVSIGGPGPPVSNNQCAIDGGQSHVRWNEGKVAVSVRVILKKGFSGVKPVFVTCMTEEGIRWQIAETWPIR